MAAAVVVVVAATADLSVSAQDYHRQVAVAHYHRAYSRHVAVFDFQDSRLSEVPVDLLAHCFADSHHAEDSLHVEDSRHVEGSVVEEEPDFLLAFYIPDLDFFEVPVLAEFVSLAQPACLQELPLVLPSYSHLSD